MKPWVKTLISQAIAIPSTVVATIAWATTHSVDLYALWKQLNVVAADIGTLISTATPLALGVYAIWRSMPGNRLQEMANDPASVKAAEQMLPTVQTNALADALKK